MTAEWSHAWVLFSLYQCGRRGGTLSDVIREADTVNHSIPNVDELDRAMRRAAAAGWLAQAGPDRYRLSSRGRRAVRRGAGRSRMLAGHIDDGLRRIDALSTVVRGLPEPDEDAPLVSSAAYDAAYAEYRRRNARSR